MSNTSPDPELYSLIGEHKADILSLKKDIQEIKDNQKVFVTFVTEQKAGRKYLWLFFATVAGFVSFGKDLLTTVFSLFSLKGIH